MSILGERIRQRRNQLGISQEELASRIGTHQKQISRYEKGENDPTGEVIIKIAQELKTHPDWLLGVDENNNLSALESEALHMIRAATDDQRQRLINVLKAMTESGNSAMVG